MGHEVERAVLARPLTKVFCLAAILSLSAWVPARASSPDAMLPDASALAMLEIQAEHAQPREQCFLYTQVLHGLTELAGQQLKAGDDVQAGNTMQQVNVIAAKIAKVSAFDAKRLKNAEQLLEHTDRRLADMAKVASGETRAAVQEALHQVDKVHTDLLALVFSH